MSEKLTLEQKAVNFDTSEHIHQVQGLLLCMAKEILDRAMAHDRSKLESPEVEMFTEFTSKLATLTYGSDEYKATVKEMGPALAHHYEKNRHHPEHFGGGVNAMNLLDVLEMFCDWKAASMRHNDGSIRKSIEVNRNRFGLSPQLVLILENSVELVEAAVRRAGGAPGKEKT